MWSNKPGAQFSGGCTWSYSDIGDGVGNEAVPGTGNINANPMLISAEVNKWHIQAGSPAINTADPASTLAVDIDGDPRPQPGSGSRQDMGADEYQP